MTHPVEELEFLSRSKHRIHILREFREPCDRQTLRDRTGVSKPTLSRAISEFEKRAWVTREGDLYRLTMLGELITEGLNSTFRALETCEKLRPLSEWLPDNQFDFALERFHDATVLAPSATDTLNVHHRLGSVLYNAGYVRELTGTVASAGIELHRRAIGDHDQTLEVILSDAALQTIRSDPKMMRLSASVFEDGSASIFRCNGTVPYFLALADDRVLIGVLDESGTIRGVIETDNPTVLIWAKETLDRYRAASVKVDSLGDGH
jgi:predicted transcriptional regulator